MSKFVDAMNFANEKHSGQVRKLSGKPYIQHPFDVGLYISLLGGSENCKIAGVLHDTLEDTNTTAKEIEEKFGPRVLKIVLSNTENKSKTWEERKQHTTDNVPNLTLDEFRLLFCDKYSNMGSLAADYETMGESVWNGFKRGKDKQEWYYGTLGKKFIEYLEIHKCDIKKSDYTMFYIMMKKYNEYLTRVFGQTYELNLTEPWKYRRALMLEITLKRISKFCRDVSIFCISFVGIGFLWRELEIFAYGEPKPSGVDTIIGLLFAGAVTALIKLMKERWG